MIYKFSAFGHPNILGTHKTTLEFTKDKNLTLKGDCIVGVKADFDLEKLKHIIQNSQNSKNKKITITIETISTPKIKEMINAEINPNFDSNNELVIRKTDFVSERTFAIKADKAAFELKRDLIGFLKGKENRMSVIIKKVN